MSKRTKQKQKEDKSSSYFSIDSEKQKKILGFFLLIFSVAFFLSIVSYSRFDKALLNNKASDLLDAFGNENVKQNFHSTKNMLGIIGAYVSDYFINSTLGYFSLIFPLIVGILGISFFHKFQFKIVIHSINFLLIIALLLSTFMGILRFEFGLFYDHYELSGKIGEYLGTSLGALVGGVGGLIFIFTLIISILVITFDFKIENFVHWFIAILSFIKSLFSSSKVDNQKTEEKDDEPLNNLSKIKNLREQKKQDVTALDEANEPEKAKDETVIRIIRKEDESVVQSKPEKIKLKLSDDPNKTGTEKSAESNKENKIVDENELTQIREKEISLPEPWDENINYVKPNYDLLNPIPPEDFKIAEDELKRNAELLKEKLALFDIQIEDISVTPGPVVTLYEIVPAPGVKISKIVSLEHDIALALAAKGIRIIAPIPGKSAIGVEIPNSSPSLVVAKSVLSKVENIKAELPLALGKEIAGEVFIADLSKMPHLLIAGSTGSGKSVGINMIISSLLYSKHPKEVKLAIIDPKKIELSFYNKIRRHYLAVSPDLDEEIITVPQNAVLLLKSVEYEMERRYDKLAKAGVRNIIDYNEKIQDEKRRPKDTETIKHHFLPYIVVIIDELADLMITAGKEVEEPIARLAQLARAVGIHLVLATQRPSVNVITGVIKANFSARIAYQVATKIDSRTILDMNGAEQLLGRGDMLFQLPGIPKPIRIQNAFISTDEVERITNYIYSQPAFSKPYYLPSLYDKKKEAAGSFLADIDPLFQDAARVIVRHQQGSVSLLQRRLKLGYARAARIVDQLEEAGIVGPGDGSKAREVIVENEEQLETILRAL